MSWVTDITYIPTGEGWLYLAVILDLCSRFAVGWATSDRITDDLTLAALGMALARRHPSQGLLHRAWAVPPLSDEGEDRARFVGAGLCLVG